MFISNSVKGRRIRITVDKRNLAGTFTKGHEFVITGNSLRGLNLVDDNGEELLESMMYEPKDGFEYID